MTRIFISQYFTSRTDFTKSRLTMANNPPRVPIMSTRPSISANVRAQRRETKYSFTNLAVSKASTMAEKSSESSSKEKFVKPSALPVRNPNLVKAATASNGNRCQYCDKFFAKSHGMTTHLLEKCEKIPTSARRQLLQKNENVDNFNSKPVFRQRPHQVEIDSVSKYSRFFTNLTNSGASSMQIEDGFIAMDVENGLKSLRAELRKVKNAHTGIIRTPSKPIRCHICKKHFLDCVEYAEHMENHPRFK